jgi:hypothetical protein
MLQYEHLYMIKKPTIFTNYKKNLIHNNINSNETILILFYFNIVYN